MPLSPERVIRRHIEPSDAYERYEPDTGGHEPVRLDWNESPFGLSPRAQATLRAFETGNRYPSIDQAPLRTALGDYLGVDPDRVIAGAGLDDVINTLATTIIEQGDEVIIHEPTFGVYRSLFNLHGATVVNVPLGPTPDFSLSVDGILGAINERTKLVLLCNPNNPTGNLFPRDALIKIIEAASCLVAIDEAYAEFSGTSHTDLALAYDNVITLRTMSKFAGLAGFRVGYGVFPEALMPWYRRAAPAFFNVSTPGAEVAIASLADLDHLQDNAERIIVERERLSALLNEIPGVLAFPSATNFVLVSLPVEDASTVVTSLARHGLLVRHFNHPHLVQCLRISIGLPEHHDRLLNVLRRVLESTPEDQT